jgi:hypothetical protein
MSEEEIYDKENREEMVDDDEVSPEEEGFMKGYDEASEESEDKEEEDKEKDPDEEE